MSHQPLRIAMLGGVPPSLGGGGLEIQRERTASALRRLGHEVFHVSQEPSPRQFDLLHVFGSELDVCHVLSHWRMNAVPLVVSPVVVVAPGMEQRFLQLTARLPLLSLAPRMRAATLRRADLLVALTRHEAHMLKALAPNVSVQVIGNAVDRVVPIAPDKEALNLRPPYALLLGTVSGRKRQAESVREIGRSRLQPVVVGGFVGGASEQAAFERVVAEANGRWLGEIRSPEHVRGLIGAADTLVQLSTAEGQSLALLEALAEGTRVACSRLPGNRELAAQFPELVMICRRESELPEVLAKQPAATRPAAIPTWDDVARQLTKAYESVLAERHR